MIGEATGTSPVPEPNNDATAAETVATTLFACGSAVSTAAGGLTATVGAEGVVTTGTATGSTAVVTAVADCESASETCVEVVDCAETTDDAERCGDAVLAVVTLS